MKPFVYIASPYTKGDPAINTRFQCEVVNQLLDTNLVIPYAPLWSHFQHTIFPRDYRDWINLDLDIIEKMDACLRLDASYEPLGYVETESSGADGEVQRFRDLSKPVFLTIEGLLDWAKRK